MNLRLWQAEAPGHAVPALVQQRAVLSSFALAAELVPLALADAGFALLALHAAPALLAP